MMKKMIFGALAFMALVAINSEVTAHGRAAVVHAINPFACAPGDFSARVHTGHVDAMHHQGRVQGKLR